VPDLPVFYFIRPKSRLKARWKADVQNDTKKMGIVNWGEELQGRDGRGRAIEEALNILVQRSYRRIRR